MKSGPELDKLVAEKVMGFTPIKDDDGTIICFVDEPNETEYFSSDDECEFSPSTDIRDAWEVVDKFSYSLQLTQSHGYWTCTMVYKINERGVGQYISAEAKIAPLAICLAALKAVGIEVKK